MMMARPFCFKFQRESAAQTIQGGRPALPKKYSLELKTELLERVMGIEPTLSAWEAEVLPLNYTRVSAHVYREVSGVSKGQAW